jgi:release factor glutamine methyltransferase
LFAGNDGLEVLRRLIGSAPRHLAREGLFVVEFGFGQADAVHMMARESGWRHVEVALDLQGIPRIAVMQR